MKQCFGYVRVSTVKQGDGVSLEAQKDAILGYAERHNLRIIKWFEETVTAAKVGRPQFNAMVSALRRGQASGMVVHKIDRSARNFADWARIGDLADAGIDIHITTESLDFRSRGGRLTADIQAVIAADYVRNLREEIRKGQQGQLKQGLYPWGAPIGYLNNGANKLKTPDPERAPFVRLAFELYATGEYSLHSLRDELTQRGFRNRAGRPLSMCGIETLLNSPFYCGIIRLGKWGETFAGKHEPLISVALYKQVQQLKSDKSGKKVTRHNHTYRGLFRCGKCGGPMIPELQKGHVYYRCHQRDCVTKSVREEELEAHTRVCLERVRFSEDDLARAEARIGEMVTTRQSVVVDDGMELQLAGVRDRLERLTDALIDRLIDKETFERRRANLVMEEAALRERQASNEDLARTVGQMRRIIELVKSLANAYYYGNPYEKRQIVKFATSNRTVIGKNVYLEPSDWLQRVENAVGILSCADTPATYRTITAISNDVQNIVTGIRGTIDASF